MSTSFRIKKLLAGTFEQTGLNGLLHSLQVRLQAPFIRAVNYHDVPPSQAPLFEEQLKYFAQHFSPVTWSDLIGFHQSGYWPHAKPGLILSFDDGYRSFHEVIAPLLEKYGFTGWFLIPAGILDIPEEEQPQWAKEHNIHPAKYPYESKRRFLTVEQLLELDKKHVVGCHTFTHQRLNATLSKSALESEIVDSKTRLEEVLGRDVPLFAWVGGEEHSYSRQAAEVIQQAGYQVALLTNTLSIRPHTPLHLLERTHLEAYFPASLLRFHLSGFMDVFYAAKRRRVHRLVDGV